MRSVRETLRWASGRLAQSGVERPAFESERLLQHVLRLNRIDLFLEPNRPVTSEEESRIESALARRCNRIPIQYLEGEAEFWSLPFFVNQAVLIPRPETETLVEAALAKLRGTARPRLADVGTGSGCVAVSLGRERPDSTVWAVDLSRPAAAVATANIRRHGVDRRVCVTVGNLLDPFPPSPVFDAVVSNPPYIPTDQIGVLEPEVRDHEPRLALDGGPDGLRVFRGLVSCAGDRLRAGGWLAMEVGAGQAGRVKDLIEQTRRFEEIDHMNDLAGIGRVVLARRR